MKVLVLGGGGREHALGRKIAQSSLLDELFFAPGNPGTAELGTNVDIDPSDVEGLGRFLKEKGIRYLLIGPEDPIVAGVRDELKKDPELSDLTVIAPDAQAARLEGSKAFAKEFMQRYGIPTAAFRSFSGNERDEAHRFLESIQAPYVIKADGLAAGKGVSIHDGLEEAKGQIDAILEEGKFGEAGQQVVIEEFLDGTELSIFILCDGTSYKILPEAKDYKRIGEGDEGPNTGGMGAVSPVPFLDKALLQNIEDRIVRPTVEGIRSEGMNYQGFLYFGLMIKDQEPYVVEYNVRLGDPEAQVILPRMGSDLLDLFEGIATDTFSERDLELDPRSAVAVVLASQGYPGKYEKGKRIEGLEAVERSELSFAGVKEEGGDYFTAGGRVIAVTGFGRDLEEALGCALEDVDRIGFEGKTYRRDIGQDLLKKQAKT